MMNEKARLGARLRSLRESRGESARDLARVLRCSRAAIYHYEKGRVLISLPDLQRIADHYAVPITYFLDREPTGPTDPDVTFMMRQLQLLSEKDRALVKEFVQVLWRMAEKIDEGEGKEI